MKFVFLKVTSVSNLRTIICKFPYFSAVSTLQTAATKKFSMHRSWNNNSSSSLGYVYYDQDTSYQPNNESPDFLPFKSSPNHRSPNPRNNFSPSYYSSPRFKQNNRFNMKQSYRYNEYNRTRSFNSSSDSFGSSDSFRGRNRHRRKLVRY